MNTYEMISQLGLRMKDAASRTFTDDFKLEALNNSQKTLCYLIHPAYLTELETYKDNVTVTTGILTLAELLAHETGTTEYVDAEVLRGADGILNVKVYGGKYARKIEATDRKDMENKFCNGTKQNPLYCILHERIYLYPTSISAVDVHYLRLPHPLLYKIEIAAYLTGSLREFSLPLGTELIKEDDYYNNMPIYSEDHNSYHIITDQAAAYPITVSPDAASEFDDGEYIWFMPQVFDRYNKRGARCELNSSLHPIIIDLAEEICWAMDNNERRRDAARKAAELKIDAYNLNQKPIVGIGTIGDRRGA